MFRVSFKTRPIDRCRREPFVLGSEQIKHLMKTILKDLSNGKHTQKPPVKFV